MLLLSRVEVIEKGRKCRDDIAGCTLVLLIRRADLVKSRGVIMVWGIAREGEIGRKRSEVRTRHISSIHVFSWSMNELLQIEQSHRCYGHYSNSDVHVTGRELWVPTGHNGSLSFKAGRIHCHSGSAERSFCQATDYVPSAKRVNCIVSVSFCLQRIPTSQR